MAKGMRVAVCVGVIGIAALAGGARAGEKDSVTAKAAFETLKGLVGDWKVETGEHGHGDGPNKQQYRLTGAGTVLMETDFPGSDHEMISMYHLDGEELILTHYCAIGNQPRLKLDRKASTASKLVFAFDGGTNFDPAKDVHIHSAVINFKDGGKEVASEWTAYQDGKPMHTETFLLKKP